MQTESKWRTQKKAHQSSTEGTCLYCKKRVKALEAHVHDKHKKELQKKSQWKNKTIKVR